MFNWGCKKHNMAGNTEMGCPKCNRVVPHSVGFSSAFLLKQIAKKLGADQVD